VDKTIELILVATVVIATAAIVLFLVQSEAEGFGEFLGDQRENADCALNKSEYERTGDEDLTQGCDDSDWTYEEDSSNSNSDST